MASDLFSTISLMLSATKIPSEYFGNEFGVTGEDINNELQKITDALQRIKAKKNKKIRLEIANAEEETYFLYIDTRNNLNGCSLYYNSSNKELLFSNLPFKSGYQLLGNVYSDGVVLCSGKMLKKFIKS